jgi:hypothetical protein
MIIIHSPERAAQNLLEEIINVQDLPLYHVETYMADTSDDDPEPDPEFTHDDIIKVLRHVLTPGFVYFMPNYNEPLTKDETQHDPEQLQINVWRGDTESILYGIRYQLDNWAAFNRGAFISKERLARRNEEHINTFGFNKFVFVEPTEAETKRLSNKQG